MSKIKKFIKWFKVTILRVQDKYTIEYFAKDYMCNVYPIGVYEYQKKYNGWEHAHQACFAINKLHKRYKPRADGRYVYRYEITKVD